MKREGTNPKLIASIALLAVSAMILTAFACSTCEVDESEARYTSLAEYNMLNSSRDMQKVGADGYGDCDDAIDTYCCDISAKAAERYGDALSSASLGYIRTLQSV